jgi:hypothetical protein
MVYGLLSYSQQAWFFIQLGATAMETHEISRYVLLLLGLLFLLINHISVMTGHFWLIPSFLRIY